MSSPTQCQSMEHISFTMGVSAVIIPLTFLKCWRASRWRRGGSGGDLTASEATGRRGLQQQMSLKQVRSEASAAWRQTCAYHKARFGRVWPAVWLPLKLDPLFVMGLRAITDLCHQHEQHQAINTNNRNIYNHTTIKAAQSPSLGQATVMSEPTFNQLSAWILPHYTPAKNHPAVRQCPLCITPTFIPTRSLRKHRASLTGSIIVDRCCGAFMMWRTFQKVLAQLGT